MNRPGNLLKEDEEDIEELKGLLDTITIFLGELGPKIAQSLTAIIESYPGEKIGKEVADFYKTLKDEDLPEDLVDELTKKYFDSINIMDKLSKLLRERR